MRLHCGAAPFNGALAPAWIAKPLAKGWWREDLATPLAWLRSDQGLRHLNPLRRPTVADRLNKSIDNLELWVTTQPAGQRPEDLVKWAREILALYGPLVEERCLERRLNDRSYERAIPPLKLLS